MITPQERERVIFELLEKLAGANAVLIGGYAVDAYVPPRYSVDCDIVVLGGLRDIESDIVKSGFTKTEDTRFADEFARYEKKEKKVAIDLMIGKVFGRAENVSFEGELFSKYSKKRAVLGRASDAVVNMRVADPELLFAMKFVSARKQDIRDIFMLAYTDLDSDTTKKLVTERCKEGFVAERIALIKKSINSDSYRKSIEGAYGKLPDERFESCAKRLLELLAVLSAHATV